MGLLSRLVPELAVGGHVSGGRSITGGAKSIAEVENTPLASIQNLVAPSVEGRVPEGQQKGIPQCQPDAWLQQGSPRGQLLKGPLVWPRV